MTQYDTRPEPQEGNATARDKPAKVQRHKTVKRRNAPKALTSSQFCRQETNVTRLTRELVEAREQQTATADVLRSSAAPFKSYQTVLDTLVRSATVCARPTMARSPGKSTASIIALRHLALVRNSPNALQLASGARRRFGDWARLVESRTIPLTMQGGSGLYI